MNTRLLRKIIGLILAALLLTSIILLAGTTAAAQRRSRRHVVTIRPMDLFEPVRPAQPIRPFHTFGHLVVLIIRSGIHTEDMTATPSIAARSVVVTRGSSPTVREGLPTLEMSPP